MLDKSIRSFHVDVYVRFIFSLPFKVQTVDKMLCNIVTLPFQYVCFVTNCVCIKRIQVAFTCQARSFVLTDGMTDGPNVS